MAGVQMGLSLSSGFPWVSLGFPFGALVSLGYYSICRAMVPSNRSALLWVIVGSWFDTLVLCWAVPIFFPIGV